MSDSVTWDVILVRHRDMREVGRSLDVKLDEILRVAAYAAKLASPHNGGEEMEIAIRPHHHQ